MPYRRLPNTDQARLRALHAALEMSSHVGSTEMLITPKMQLDAKMFTPIFEQTIRQYNDARELQSSLSKQVDSAAKMARMYLSHFVQVFNMCVARGEIKREMREMIGLKINDDTLPAMETVSQILSWGKTIIEGEEKRMAQGEGNRIYNPSIAVVKVKVIQLNETHNKHQDLLQTIQKHHVKVEEIRPKADALILEMWNEIEKRLEDYSAAQRRDIASRYGVVYIYRPSEREQED
ncbi:MAG: hypothetical protein Q4C30_03280 [Bacteroidia bacterium]|nr:hypothetical protein [Bacteroidia bacterium]